MIESRTIPEAPHRNEPGSLYITNEKSRYSLKHGKEYQSKLDPRDQVLEHRFGFALRIEEFLRGRASFEESELRKDLLKEIEEFLVEAVSNVVSSAFRFLCKDNLTEGESKEFAAKNVMLNIHAIFRETHQALRNEPEF